MLRQAVSIPADSALPSHVPWEGDPCEAEAGSQGVAPGLPEVVTEHSRKVENLPVTTELWDSFSCPSQAGAVKSQHVTLGVTY